MNRFHSLTAGALVAGMLVTGAAFAQDARGGRPGGRGLGVAGGPAIAVGLPLGSLGLTETQQDLIGDIRMRSREAVSQAHAKLREAQEAQRKAFLAIPPDEALVRTSAQALADAHVEVALQHARVQSEVLAVLTPEQHEQLRKTVAEREARRQQRRAQADARRERLRQDRQ